MSLVIAAFDCERGFLASEGRVTGLEGGKIRILAEDRWKHLQIDGHTAFAAAGHGQLVISALEIVKDIAASFAGRTDDLAGGLRDFFSAFVKRAPSQLPDAPIPIAVMVLSKDRAGGWVNCFLAASGRGPQEFGAQPGGGPQLLILSPADSTSDFLSGRLRAVLPPIFARNRGRSFERECKAAIGAAVKDAAKMDPRINSDVRFAFIGE